MMIIKMMATTMIIEHKQHKNEKYDNDNNILLNATKITEIDIYMHTAEYLMYGHLHHSEIWLEFQMIQSAQRQHM